MNWPELFTRGVELARRVVPELAPVPIYMVSQIGTAFEHSSPLAMTGPRVDLMLKDHLGQSWEGRGIGVIFNTPLIEEWFPDIEAWFFPAVIHEVCHALAGGFALTRHLERDDHPAEKIAAFTASVAECAKEQWWNDDDGPTALEFISHDDRWIRCACHLATRAGLTAVQVIGNNRAELSHPAFYAVALTEEIYTNLDTPIIEILNTTAPEAFREYWANDVLRFAESREARRVAALSSDSESKEVSTMSTSILEKIVSKLSGRQQAKQKTALEQYVAVARQIADDKEPTEDIESVLDAAGKTPEDLKADVEKILHRRGLQQTVARAKGVARERAQLDQKLAAGKAAFDEAEKIWTGIDYDCNCRIKELNELDRQADASRAALQNTCTDPNLLAERGRLEAEVSELGKEIVRLDAQKRDAERLVESREAPTWNATETQGGTLGWDRVADIKARAALATAPERATVSGIVASQQEIKKQVDGLDKEIEATREKMVASESNQYSAPALARRLVAQLVQWAGRRSLCAMGDGGFFDLRKDAFILSGEPLYSGDFCSNSRFEKGVRDMTVPIQNTTPLFTTFGTSKPSNGFSLSPTVGNSLIAICVVNGVATVTGVVDSKSNSGWVALASGTLDGNNDNIFVWILPALAAGKVASGQTVTFTLSANCYATVTVYEVPRVNATPLDGSHSGVGITNGSTTLPQPSSGNLSTAASNDIVFTVFGADKSVASVVQPSGYSTPVTENSIPGSVATAISWLNYSSPQTNINPAWTGLPGSAYWTCLAFGVNFTTAPGGGGGLMLKRRKRARGRF